MTFRLLFIVLIAAILWHPHATEAALQKCSRIIRQNGRDVLINTCGDCRIVGIQRSRPGQSAPISRKVTIPSKSRVTLSFRGPGQSRITSDNACRPKAGGQSLAPGAARNDGVQCIQMNRSGAGLALINTCGRCRMAVIERLNNQGGKRMQNVAIGARKAIALPSKGAAYARILSEKNCK